MCPGDPNQVEAEMTPSYFVLIESAVIALLMHRSETEDDETGVSAMDVFNFLKGVGSTLPIAHVLYTEMQFAEVISLLQQAEEEGSTEKLSLG